MSSWASVAKKGKKRQDAWASPFDLLPLEIVVLIAVVWHDPKIYLAMVQAYLPLTRYARSHMKGIISNLTKDIVGIFNYSRSRGGFDYSTLPIEYISLRRSERIHCVVELVAEMTRAKIFAKKLGKTTCYEGSVQKVRYNIMPNNVVENHDDERLAIIIRYRIMVYMKVDGRYTSVSYTSKVSLLLYGNKTVKPQGAYSMALMALLPN